VAGEEIILVFLKPLTKKIGRGGRYGGTTEPRELKKKRGGEEKERVMTGPWTITPSNNKGGPEQGKGTKEQMEGKVRKESCLNFRDSTSTLEEIGREMKGKKPEVQR